MNRSAALCERTGVAPKPRSLFAILRATVALRTQRARLAKLDDHLLQDIGLTRDDAEEEAMRPFWDPPEHWLR